jgi:hypothetical protein
MLTDTDDAIDTGGERAPSIRDALSAAFDAPEADDVQDTPAVEPEQVPEASPDRSRDEAGRFAKGRPPLPATEEKPETQPPVKAKPPEVRKPGAPGAPVVPPVTPAVELPKAPQSWKPLAREKWAALPEEARAEVLRREKEINEALSTTKADRDFAASVRQQVAPFEAAIRAEGSTPEKAIGNLLQTAMALRTAPAGHKAALVAGIIRDYGVPLEGLVAALQGQPMPQQQHQAFDPGQLAQQIQSQVLQGIASQRQAAMAEKMRGEADSFMSAQEFGEELREDMADILDRAAKRGTAMTLQQAYDRAAREHPEVSKVIDQRAAAERAAKATASTQRSRIAASSVRSHPSTTPVQKTSGMSLRDSIAAAFDGT